MPKIFRRIGANILGERRRTIFINNLRQIIFTALYAEKALSANKNQISLDSTIYIPPFLTLISAAFFVISLDTAN